MTVAGTIQGVPGATGILTPGEDGSIIGVIEERGYVDGIEVARKCSKANVQKLSSTLN